MKRKQSLLLLLVSLLIVSMACSVITGTSSQPEAPVVAEEQVEEIEEAVEAEEPAAEETESEEPAAEAEEPTAEEADAEEPAAEAEEAAPEYDTEFPLPDNVQNFTDLGDDQINFATSLTVEESIAFYRDELGKMGLTEREINTAITDDTFSMVFDGHESGKEIVVQGVDLGDTTNINIRFEDV